MSDWFSDAACRGSDPNMFFPSTGEHTPLEVRWTCSGCPVRSECLNYALVNNIRDGIWGGVADGARRKMRYERRHA